MSVWSLKENDSDVKQRWAAKKILRAEQMHDGVN